jgi:fumarate reductase subunit D
MKALLVRIEPIIWLLFGQGILIGTILLTAWILVIGLLIPLGLVSADALSYERAYRLATAAPLGIPIGRLVLLAVMALPLWKGAHHVRSLLLDFGGVERDALVGSTLYATAAVGSLAAVVAVFRL